MVCIPWPFANTHETHKSRRSNSDWFIIQSLLQCTVVLYMCIRTYIYITNQFELLGFPRKRLDEDMAVGRVDTFVVVFDRVLDCKAKALVEIDRFHVWCLHVQVNLWCACVSLSSYVWINVCVYINIYIYIYMYVFLNIYMYIYIRTYIHTHTLYIYIYICMHIYTYTCIYVYIYTYVYIHTYM